MQRVRREYVRMEKILKWIKEHKLQLLIGAGVVFLLAAAFWYGSGSPDSRGFFTKQSLQTASEEQKEGKDKKAEKIPEAATGDAIAGDTGKAMEVLTAQGQAAGARRNSTDENISSDRGLGNAETGSQENSADKEKNDSQSLQPDGSKSSFTAGQQPAADTNTMIINPDTGKDKYQTEPIPAGKPEPVEPEDTEPGEKKYSCTISISCATILDNMNLLDKNKTGLIPKDGWILKPVTVSFQEGESVFDVLQRVCREKKIHMEFSNTPMYNSAYIEGIHNIYEFDAGSLSGWNYKVNDWFPNYGCSRYQLKDGDVICWMYTCNLGRDVGGSNASGQ